jgi:antitoxin component YwqK of YwqJK toxin-antitoxin module
LTYNPFSVPDGEYLAYYVSRPYKFDKDDIPLYSHEDTTRVAAIFTVKRNLLEGKITCYDFYSSDKITQIGNYVNGKKEGEWKVVRDASEIVYYYKNGLKQGKASVRRNGSLVEEADYVLGQKKVHRFYYPEGGLESEEKFYEDGRVKTKYFKSGQMNTYFNSTDTATYIRKNWILSGQLTATKRAVGEFFEEKEYHSNGQLSSKSMYAYDTLKEYSLYQEAIAKKVGYFLSSNSRKRIMSYSRFNNAGENLIDFDINKPLGTVFFKYYGSDTLKVMNDSTVVVSDKDGKEMEYTTFEWLRPHHYTLTEIKSKTYYKGKLSESNLTSSYLSSKHYKDSFGMVLKNTYYSKKSTTYKYYLLHNGLKYKKKVPNKAKHSNETYTHRLDINGTDTILYVLREQISKDKLLTVRHEARVKCGKSFKENNDWWESSSLSGFPDTSRLKIFYNDKPFTGKIVFNKSYKGLGAKNKSKTKLKKPKSRYPTLKVKKFFTGSASYTSSDYAYHSRSSYSDVKINLTRGIFDGNAGEEYSQNYNYKNGLLDGEQGRYSNPSFYENGQKLGRFVSYNSETNYLYNKRHGLHHQFGMYFGYNRVDGQIGSKSFFVNDTLHGLHRKYYYPTKVYEEVNFKHGLPDGPYAGGTTVYPHLKEFVFDNGFLVDTGRVFFKEGTLKAEVVYDENVKILPKHQVTLGIYNKYPFEYPYDTIRRLKAYYDDIVYSESGNMYRSYRRPEQVSIASFNSSNAGVYKYYYKNGMMSMQGTVKEQQRIGEWKFYDVNGGLLKVVNYDSSFHIFENGDTLFHYGTISMFYPNGKPLLKGLIRFSSSRYKCDQEQDVDMENIYYLEFYDEEGNQVISESVGRVYEFHSNGTKRLEGDYANGKRQGLWKFYDPDGRLEEVGSYLDGKRVGIWYEGDLQGIPYFDNACDIGVIDDTPDTWIAQEDKLLFPVEIQTTVYKDEGGYAASERRLKLFPL